MIPISPSRLFLAVILSLALAGCGTIGQVKNGAGGAQGRNGAIATAPLMPVLPGAGAGLGPTQPGVVPGLAEMTRVALLLPLTGQMAPLGQALLNAAELSVFKVAGRSFALMPIDTKGTPEGAAAAFRTATAQGAQLVLGPLFSASVQAVAPLARAQGIEVISFSNDRTVAGNGVYIMGFTPEAQVDRIVSYAWSRGIDDLAAILPANVYGNRVAAELRDIAERLGIRVPKLVRYTDDSAKALAPILREIADYPERHAALLQRRQELEARSDEASKQALKRLKDLDTLGDPPFDAVLLPEGDGALRAIAPLLSYYDVDPRRVRRLGSVQWDDPEIATEPALMGGWFPAPAPEQRKQFEALYRKTYGQTPPRIAGIAYDATALAAVLARRAAPGPVAATSAPARAVAMPAAFGPEPVPTPSPFTAAALTSPSGFAGMDGIFRLLPSGLIQRGLAVMEVRNRHFAVVDPAPKTFQGLDYGLGPHTGTPAGGGPLTGPQASPASKPGSTPMPGPAAGPPPGGPAITTVPIPGG